MKPGLLLVVMFVASVAAFPIAAASQHTLITDSRRASERSIDCDRTKTAVEVFICRSPVLVLDNELADRYKRALAVTPDRAALVIDQKRWLATRGNGCAVIAPPNSREITERQTSCLSTQYERRIADLRKIANQTGQDYDTTWTSKDSKAQNSDVVYLHDLTLASRWVAGASKKEKTCGLIKDAFGANDVAFAEIVLQSQASQQTAADTNSAIAIQCNIPTFRSSRDAQSSAYDDTGLFGLTAFQIALSKDERDIIKLFMKYGGDVTASPNKSLPPIILSVMSGDIPTVERILVGHPNVDVERKDTDFQLRAEGERGALTPLDIAYRRGYLAIFEQLLNAGSNARDRDGTVILRDAVRHCNGPVLRSLIVHGANLKALIDDDQTPEYYLYISSDPSGALCPPNTLPGVTDTADYATSDKISRDSAKLVKQIEEHINN